jgi:hypothetical protein
VPVRVIWIGATAAIGLASQAAETAGGTDASGFALAAIIAASCTGAIGLIGAITNATLRFRAHAHGRRRRQLSGAERMLRRAELEAQLEELAEEDP